MPTRLHIGGVPEHFNLPWSIAVEKDAFGEAKIDVAWTYFSGGTGAMTKALASGDLDMAILLTEGYVSAIAQGLTAKIVKVYIDTPLIWGIHSASPNVHSVEDCSPRNYAISRMGSGSHLMAMIHAQQLGIPVSEEQLKIVNTLDGAIDSLVKQETQLFYWEKYMTRPFVEKGLVKKVGEFSAPWSSFLVVATEESLAKNGESIKKVLDIMNARCAAFASNAEASKMVSHVFHMSLEEADAWLQRTQWNNGYDISRTQLENAQKALEKIGITTSHVDFSKYLASWMGISY